MTLCFLSDAISLASIKAEKTGTEHIIVKTKEGYQVMTKEEIRQAASASAEIHANAIALGSKNALINAWFDGYSKGLDDAKEVYRGDMRK